MKYKIGKIIISVYFIWFLVISPNLFQNTLHQILTTVVSWNHKFNLQSVKIMDKYGKSVTCLSSINASIYFDQISTNQNSANYLTCSFYRKLFTLGCTDVMPIWQHEDLISLELRSCPSIINQMNLIEVYSRNKLSLDS